MRNALLMLSVFILCSQLPGNSASAQAGKIVALKPASNPADNPEYYRKDPDESVITEISGWSHPTKRVLQKYRLKLTKVELMWGRTFPVFHIESFGTDPASGPGGASLVPLLHDLLRANGNHAYKIVEDDAHDGFVVAYDPRRRSMNSELVEDEAP